MYINKKLHTLSRFARLKLESCFKIVYFFYTPCITKKKLKFFSVLVFKKYKTFSCVDIQLYHISENWKNEKLICGNTTQGGVININTFNRFERCIPIKLLVTTFDNPNSYWNCHFMHIK